METFYYRGFELYRGRLGEWLIRNACKPAPLNNWCWCARSREEAISLVDTRIMQFDTFVAC